MHKSLLLLFAIGTIAFLSPAAHGQKVEIASGKIEVLSDTTAIEGTGDAYSRKKEWRKAVNCYGTLIKMAPQTAQYHYKYGGALAMYAQQCSIITALGIVKNIENAFLTTIRLDPKHINARWALVELYLELPGILGGSEKKALRYAKELQNLSSVDGFMAKGRISEYFERFADAEKWYLKAFEAGHSKTCCDKLVSLYAKMHQPAKAVLIKEKYEMQKASASAVNPQFN